MIAIVEFIRYQMLKSESERNEFNEVVLFSLNEIGQIKGRFKFSQWPKLLTNSACG
uniref:Uncharacterized protein n=1 Tax=Vibrio genomosp. F6 TaxID=723172 RepID=A0A0H3ZY39_9VIBR|nr:hypothetical protein [Vibrio genomosp. F6]